MSADSRPVVFCMTGAAGVTGGVAAVNLNALLALVDLTRRLGLPPREQADKWFHDDVSDPTSIGRATREF